MEMPVLAPSKCEIRSVIRFLTAQKKTAEIHRELCSVYGGKCMRVQMVQRWQKEFLKGREKVHDEARAGRPMKAVNKENVALLKQLIAADARYTLNELAARLGSRGNVVIPPFVASSTSN